jgi:hypothetical protein
MSEREKAVEERVRAQYEKAQRRLAELVSLLWKVAGGWGGDADVERNR